MSRRARRAVLPPAVFAAVLLATACAPGLTVAPEYATDYEAGIKADWKPKNNFNQSVIAEFTASGLFGLVFISARNTAVKSGFRCIPCTRTQRSCRNQQT